MDSIFFTSLTGIEVKELFRKELESFFETRSNEQNRPSAKEFSKPVSQKELAKYLGVTEPTIIRWRQKGSLPFIKIGSAIRYDVAAVLEALTTLNKRKMLR